MSGARRRGCRRRGYTRQRRERGDAATLGPVLV